MNLTKSTIFLAKSHKRGQKSRNGFIDENKQVYLPPINSKRLTAWQKKMESKGFSFGG